MNKPFKVLKGNRVFVIAPEIPESNLYLDENVKQVLMEKEIEKLNRMKVYAVGETILDIKEGDELLIDRGHLAQAPLIDLGNGIKVLLVSYFNVIMVW